MCVGVLLLIWKISNMFKKRGGGSDDGGEHYKAGTYKPGDWEAFFTASQAEADRNFAQL